MIYTGYNDGSLSVVLTGFYCSSFYCISMSLYPVDHISSLI